MTSHPLAVPAHLCKSSKSCAKFSNFCEFCGVFLPSTSLRFDEEGGSLLTSKALAGERVVRSSTFELRDPHGSHSAQALAEMIRKQGQNRYYHAKPAFLPYRKKVLEWIESLVSKFGFQPSTLNFAMGYFDAVLSLYTVSVAQIKLIAYICIIIAAKMEEQDHKIPMLEEGFKLFDKEFTSDEILNYEKLVFKILNYQLNMKTPFTFAAFFLSKGVLQLCEIPIVRPDSSETNAFAKKLEGLVITIVLRSLRDYDFYKFTSIAVAASSIAVARKILQIPGGWTRHLEELTLLSWSTIQECVEMLESASADLIPHTFGSPDKFRQTASLSTKEHSPVQTVDALAMKGSATQCLTR